MLDLKNLKRYDTTIWQTVIYLFMFCGIALSIVALTSNLVYLEKA